MDSTVDSFMQYLLHPETGASRITLEGDAYRYLIKVRRHRVGDRVALRRGGDHDIYFYILERIERRTAELSRQATERLPITPRRALHIGWCRIDPKMIEKVLPILNEIGVSATTFIDCDRSQKHFRLDPERLEKILTNSSQQCGRSDRMRITTASDIATFLAEYPEAQMLHFSDATLSCDGEKNATVIIGPEGGFTDAEAALFAPDQIVGLDTPIILRSESAAVAVASRILL